MILRIRSRIDYLISTCNILVLLLHVNSTQNLVLLAGFNAIY